MTPVESFVKFALFAFCFFVSSIAAAKNQKSIERFNILNARCSLENTSALMVGRGDQARVLPVTHDLCVSIQKKYAFQLSCLYVDAVLELQTVYLEDGQAAFEQAVRIVKNHPVNGPCL